jgi:hypothetical protein
MATAEQPTSSPGGPTWDETILVLSLDADTGRYDEVGHYAPGDTARSSLLEGFCIEVDQVFAQD